MSLRAVKTVRGFSSIGFGRERFATDEMISGEAGVLELITGKIGRQAKRSGLSKTIATVGCRPVNGWAILISG